MADEGFHEIQLNGKQLIFLFMAAAVVAVVVFLSGVMVGRGVRAEKVVTAQSDAMALSPDIAPTGTGAGAGGAQTPQASPAPATPPPQPVNDELSYYNRLEGQTAAADVPKPAPGPPPAAKAPAEKAAAVAPGAAAVSPPQPTKADAPAKPGPDPAAADPVGRAGYLLQVVALKDRAAADVIVKRLTTKGYQAYLLDPTAGSSLFRVRVGPFKTRPEAEDARRRLEKEERFKPSLIR
jgi:DedD protein